MTKSCAVEAPDLHIPWREDMEESRNEASLLWEQLVGQVVSLLDALRSWLHEPIFLYRLLHRKAQTSCMVTTVSHDVQKLQETCRKFLEKIRAWLHKFPLHQNHIYPDLAPLPLWSIWELSGERWLVSQILYPDLALLPLWRIWELSGECWLVSQILCRHCFSVWGECLSETRRETPSPHCEASRGERN